MMAGTGSVIVKIYGGLGNQMFQYAAGRALAVRLGLPLELDLGFYGKKRHRKFELERFPIVASVMEPQGMFGRVLRKLPGAYGPGLFRESSFRFDPGFAALDAPAVLDGYFQSPLYFEGIADSIRRELSPPVPKDHRLAELGEFMRTTGAISLHVRRGDYVSDKNAAALFASCTPEYYRSALAQLPPELPVVAFSDDVDWVKSNMDFARPVRFAADVSPTDGPGDLWLMTQARHHVIANSTFSWWGAWLKVQEGKTIFPRPWFLRNDMDETDLIPPDWLPAGVAGGVA